MRILLLTAWAGPSFSWRAYESVDCNGSDAQRLIARGLAEEIGEGGSPAGDGGLPLDPGDLLPPLP